MLRITMLAILSMFLLKTAAMAQDVQDDFEGNGTITSWFGDDCGMDNAFANPFSQGLNPSSTVLKYTDSGGTFANVRFDIAGTFDLMNQSVFRLLVYVPASGLTGAQPNQISLKLQDGSLGEPWTTQCEIIKPLVLDQWQEVSFDFAQDAYLNLNPASPPPLTRSDFSRVVLQINGENNQDQVTAYLDDFLLEEGEPAPEFQQLVWSDEFDGAGMIDTSKWFHQTLLPDGVNWFNGEQQHYTNRLENSFLENGFLNIVLKRETFTDQGQTKLYTSARLNSKFAFTYGRVEVRAKLPMGLGTWPAIWMLGKNIDEPGAYWQPMYGDTPWPACGEIDIMEHWGHNPNYVQSALHTPSSFGATVNHGGLLADDVANQFHVYAVEWTEDRMQFSLDSTVFYTYAPDVLNADTWPFFEDQYLLLNIAMAGNIDPNFTESAMVIDYVRVYQEGPPTSVEENLRNQIQLYPNPVQDYLTLELPASLQDAPVQVFSLTGWNVDLPSGGSRKRQLDWRHLPAAVYVLQVQTPEGLLSFKVVKQ